MVKRILAGDEPLDRRSFVLAALALAVGKYAIDAAVIYAITGLVWTPVDYVFPLVSLGGSKANAFPAGLSILLLAWTIPFIWLGIFLSARRARDARLPVWIVAAFFLPVLNYVLLLVLAAAPHRAPSAPISILGAQDVPEAVEERRPPLFDGSSITAMAAGAAFAVGAVLIGVQLLRTYGLALFLGSPFLLGVVTGYVSNLRTERTAGETGRLVCGATLLAAAGILVVALEGAVCLFLAFPIAIATALPGGLIGRSMALHRGMRTGWAGMIVMLVTTPTASVFDRAFTREDVREITTTVEVDAPPSVVWHHVISFEEIRDRPELSFRLGLAYPIRARIDGSGVGATRYCEFSTGAFVEPITVWDAPSRLAFDVTAQPAPLQEWSPYAHVYAPHLRGFLRTTHGEFRLVPLPGERTRLEGRTWYTLRMAPALYWNPIADAVVHRIHARVLRHVKQLAEVQGDR